MDSTTSPTLLRPQIQLLSRPAPRLSSPFDDHNDSPTLNSPSPRNSSSPLHLTIHELLLLPPSPHRRPKLHHITKETLDPPPSEATPRRKGKSRNAATTISPRNGRRARRRLEKEIVREEKELCPLEDEAGKARKKRQSKPRPARKEKLSLVSLLPSSTAPTKPEIISGDDHNSLDGMWKLITDLVMWKNAARSTLWFGFGSSLFLSSTFSGDVGFSTISASSHLGILILGLAFVYDSISQRKQKKKKKGARLRLTEKEVLRVSRLILPVLNAALEKSQEIFSGEPMMTLKVAPVLFFMAKFGYLITLWRLLAIGFFLSFTAPKFYSFYYQQIQQRVEDARNYVLESWRSCSRKKLVATSTAALLWNIFDIKMRIFAAFITMVIFRCVHQQHFVGEYLEAANIDRESMVGEQYQNGEASVKKAGQKSQIKQVEVDSSFLKTEKLATSSGIS